jgi:lysozyme
VIKRNQRRSKIIRWFLGLIILILSIGMAIWLNNFSWIPPEPPVIKIPAPDIVRHPQSTPAWGIDISHHQKQINWNHFQDPHVPNFVFLKATEGSHFTDSRFSEYSSQLKEKKIPYSGYHFFRYNVNGAEQARFFLSTIKPRKGQLIPVVDIEDQIYSATEEVAQINIDLFMETIRNEIGVYPIVYCDEKHYRKYIQDKYLNKVILWIAQYTREPNVPYDIWQKTPRYRHPAFKYRIDYNVMNHNRISILDLTL